MQTEMKKSGITIVGGEKVHPRLVEVSLMLIKKAFDTAGKEVDNVVINFLDNHPKKKTEALYSSFTAPNLISINLGRHIVQMADMAQEHYVRASTVLWYELLLSLGHELHHMLMEYLPFEEHYSNNVEALQIGPKYNCITAEKWSKKQILALGFEYDINPPEEWGTGITEDDMLSEQLSNWQHVLPDIDEPWAARQQEMIDRNITWLDNDVSPEITLDKFSDWQAVEGNWTIPIWKVKLEEKSSEVTAVEAEIVEEEKVATTEQSEPIEEEIEAEPVVDVEYEDVYVAVKPGEDVGEDVEYEDVYVAVQPGEEVVGETAPILYEKPEPVPEFMTNPIVNPTLQGMKIAMYHTFMAVYKHIFDKCGWTEGVNGFSFTNTSGVYEELNLSAIPGVERIVVNYVGPNKAITPTWPDGTITGVVFVNGTIPAVKLGIRTTSGKILTYTAVAQNPMKDSSWGKSAKAGVKSLIIFKNDDENNSTIVIRILNGQFISNPLGLNGGKATTVTAETAAM